MSKEDKYKKMMERNALYAEDYRKGMTVTQIQRKYGAKSDSIVRHALKKEGRKERGVATRDTAERKTASRENERSGNNAKTD